MPSYVWTCLACGESNFAASHSCAVCGCPASATASQVQEAFEQRTVKGEAIVSDRGASGLRSDFPARAVLRRLAVFLFGVMPSDSAPWRAPIVVWITLGLSAILLLISHGIRRWGWLSSNLDSSTLATGASVASTLLLSIVTTGVALVRAKQLIMPPGQGNNVV